MKKLFTVITILSVVVLIQYSCDRPSPHGHSSERTTAHKEDKTKKDEAVRTDEFFEGKGIGAYTNVELNDPLDQELVEKGQRIHNMQCASCHHATERFTVGPGIKGITTRRTPEWIMNMITNVDVMLDEDPVARQLLEECKVRMPDMQTADEDARAILEYYFHNDKKS